MPTKKPRITITLSERHHAVLASISRSGGQSMSGLVTDLLDLAMPTFERMAVTFQHLQKAGSVDQAKIFQAMADAQAVMEPIAAESVAQVDAFLGKVEASARHPSKPEARGRGSRAKPAATPRTNRGVTPIQQQPSKPLRHKG